MDVYVKTQAELDAIPLDTKDFIYIDFGTMEKLAIVKRQYRNPVNIINNSVVVTYNNSEVTANINSIVYAYGNSKVCAYDNSIIYARDNSEIYARDNSEVGAYDDSIVYARDNSEVWARDNSKVWAYDNSEVCAWNDKNIVSINDNAIVTSPSILCSGAELLNQCNGYIGDIKFTVSNVSDNDKENVFGNLCYTGDFSKRAFILTMCGIPYYCVYDFNTMSVKFYTMNFHRAFESVADDTAFTYYIDNVLMPALVNAKFDRSTKSNII